MMPNFAQKNAREVRYAVVGLGYISQVAVLPAFEHARENSRLVALVSDDPAKRQELSKKYQVDKTCGYDQYDELLRQRRDRRGLHRAAQPLASRVHGARAREAGIHVLCEKPMAVTADDCEAMIRAAEQQPREADDRVSPAFRGRQSEHRRADPLRPARRRRASSTRCSRMSVRTATSG